MKNLIPTLISALFLASVFCSCNDSLEKTAQDELTEADILVNSPEYEAYELVLKTDRRMMRKIFKNMSSSQKELYFETLSTLPKASDINSFDSICQELTTILGIDFNERIERIRSANTDFLQDKNIPFTEILKALQRKNVNGGRSISSVEDEMAYSKCVYACERMYDPSYCQVRNEWEIDFDDEDEEEKKKHDWSGYNWWDDMDYRVCMADMAYERDMCIDNCTTSYL